MYKNNLLRAASGPNGLACSGPFFNWPENECPSPPKYRRVALGTQAKPRFASTNHSPSLSKTTSMGSIGSTSTWSLSLVMLK